MAITVQFLVEDVATQIALYDKIRLYRGTSATGSFSFVANVSLVAGQFSYNYPDSSGTINSWYKWSLYNSVSTAESDKTVAFRPGNTSLLRIRQYALEHYKCGLVMNASAVGTSTSIVTTDFRFKVSILQAGQGKGAFLYPTSGSRVGEARMITDSSPTAGTFTISPAMDGALAIADEFEWHWMARPDQWNTAIRAGLARYYHIDRVPIAGDADADEYNLSIFPWLHNKKYARNLHVLWASADTEELWGVMGRWWKIRQDQSSLTLQIAPRVPDDAILYLECYRPFEPLWADADIPPVTCNEQLAAALAYDEILSLLSRPGEGSRIDKGELIAERQRHQATELRLLLEQERQRASFGLPQLPYPSSVPSPFRAR